MHIFIERWCACRARTRALAAGLAAGTMALAAWSVLVKPLHTSLTALEAQRAEAMHARAALWAAARRLPSPATPGDATARAAFSPLDFQEHDMRLVRWKPDQGGGELTLEALWAQIPALFARLAQRQAEVVAFEIHPDGARLRLILQLELPHAR